MKNEVKNSLFNTILVSICVFVGVGFITGAEIWFYFAKFGRAMYFGLLIFGVLCFFLVYFSLSDNKNPCQTKFKNICHIFSELFVASAMISGLIEITRKLFIKNWFMVFLLAFCVMVYVFWNGYKGVIIYNYFVAIFIIFVTICMFLFDNKINTQNIAYITNNLSFKNITLSCLFSAVYIFMNASEMHPILSNYQEKNSKIKKIILSFSISSILIFLIFTLSKILLLNKNITSSSMPFLLLFNNKGAIVKYVFIVGLILTLVSTAIACLSGVNSQLEFVKNEQSFQKIFVILLSLIVAQLPFSFFVKIIYPIIGIINFINFIFDIIFSLKSKNELKI